VFVSIDAGTVVNTDHVRNQCEGGSVYGLSCALGQITATNGIIDQGNFNDYLVARMDQAPKRIEVDIIESDAPPAGVGEPPTPPFAPAFANALFEATGDDAWRHRAETVIDLFHTHFFDAETGTLGEFFTADWRPAEGADGTLREPGHHFEWVWLLLHYRRLTGDDSVVEPADRLYRTALDFGVDAPPRGIPAAFDAVDSSGAVVESGKRLWPQTEAIKAHLARHELLADPKAEARARAHLAMMFDHYLDADSPVWWDRLARDGEVLSDTIPASTLYHLFLCIAETMRVLGRD